MLDGVPLRFEPGSLFYFPRGMNVRLEQKRPRLEYDVVLLQLVERSDRRLEAVEGLSVPWPPFLTPGRLMIRDNSEVRRRFDRLLADAGRATGRANAPDSVQVLRHSRLQALLSCLSETDPAVRSLEGRLSPRANGSGLGDTIRFMDQAYRGKINLDTLAAKAGFTPSSYSRAFANAVGLPPLEYLTRVRVAAAKRLLTADSQVKTAAVRVGFDNEFHFSRTFKQTVGIAPSLFKNRHSLSVAVASCLALEGNLTAVGRSVCASVDCYRYPGMEEAEYARIWTAQLDTLRRARPGLIIADYFHAPLRELLQQIAPVVMLDNVPDWLVNFRRMAELAGVEDAAERTLEELACRERVARERLLPLIGGDSIALMQINHRVVRLHGTAHHPLNELVYGGLGLKPGANMPTPHFRQEFPPEWLPAFDADRLFIHQHHAKAGSDQVCRKLERTDAWQSIRAVREGKVRRIPNWFCLSWTPPGRLQILRELVAWAEADQTACP